MFRKTLQALVIATAVAIPAAAIAYPNTTYQAQIENQINSVIRAARNQGFNLIVANQRGHMYGNGTQISFTVFLNAGTTYRFEGRCDTDCTDVDMALRDGAGNELAADRLLDDYPGFVINAPYTGLYTVTLEMARCNAYRCQVGAVVMARA